MEFGKNRVQYEEFLWTYYRFDKFDTYFYTGGKELAVYTAKTAQDQIKEMEVLFDYELENKLQFVIYNKLSHFRQSNVGLAADDQYNIGGVTRIVGSKVFLYFEGDHAKLDKQIRAGIAEVLANEMLYGGDLKDIMKNSALLSLPEWYVKGLVSYVSNPWDVDIENKVKDGILSGKYTKFNRLTGNDAINAGHALWHFIAETYGSKVISNIIYMTQVSRNIESGFIFVLGASLKTLTDDWIIFYKNKYEAQEENRTLPLEDRLPVKTKKARVYSQLKISPDGKYVAFVTNELGQYKVWLYDIERKKASRIMKSGYKLDRINDYSYPLLVWHPTGELLSIITEEKAKPYLVFYTLEAKKLEKQPILLLDKVLDFSYSHDGKKMAMSAVIKGQSDIFLYNIGGNTAEPVTKDIFDDLTPRFINNSKQIIFSSNRTDDTIRFDKAEIKSYSSNKDIFIYNAQGKSSILSRVTATPLINETDPMDFGSARVTYLSNKNGVKNRFIAEFDSTISHVDTTTHYRYTIKTTPITNYSRNIIEHETNLKSNKITEIIYSNGKYQLIVKDIDSDISQTYMDFDDSPGWLGNKSNTILKADKANNAQDTIVNKAVGDTSEKAKPRFQAVKISGEDGPKDSTAIDINNYEFDRSRNNNVIKTKVPPPAINDTAVSSLDKPEIPQPEFMLPNLRNYNITYFPDYIVTQLGNNFSNSNYQRFTGGGAIYYNPGFNGLFKIGISDLFEDKKIVGAVRLSTNLKSNEYFLSHENLTKRLDKQYIFHRQALTTISGAALVKVQTNEAKYVMKWPFNEVASIRGSVNLRHDKIDNLATDFINLQAPTSFDYWGSLKLEYVFDNTLKKGLNLYNGMRYKLFAEYYKHLEQRNTEITIIGLDFRHYQKIHRDLIWANRLAASSSFGSRKLIYYMGGVDNWLIPRFDNSIRIGTDQNYTYQALATNMRGFYQNARNGNSFAVINSELRFPIFKYFMNKPIKSDFISNFQVIGFGDIGTAWTGKSPYSEDNTLNTQVINANPLIITLKNQKEPIIGGYGWGLRSRVWGYFVRADWAWGVEDGVALPRVFYLSLSLDF